MWIVRHGNRHDFVYPEWFNTAEKKYDPPLSEDGIIQANVVAKKLKNEPIKHIFCSPFLRAIETAYPIAIALNLSLKIESGLGEWHNKDWMDSKPLTQYPDNLEKKYLDIIDWNYQPQIYPPYPETLEEIYQRSAKTIDILKNYPNSLIVGHSVAIQGMIVALVKNESQPITIPLGSITKLKFINNRWQWELRADTSHLSHLPPPKLAQ
ncbi:MAG: histidine phosphatase family protein [Cyanobacterium sp.]